MELFTDMLMERKISKFGELFTDMLMERKFSRIASIGWQNTL